MKLKLDAATSQRRDDVISIVMAAFAMFVCELGLVKWILAQPGNQRDLVDYGYLVILPVPFLLGLRLKRRVNTLQSTEEESFRASAQISEWPDVGNLQPFIGSLDRSLARQVAFHSFWDVLPRIGKLPLVQQNPPPVAAKVVN
jgi:hypothetical protein